MDTDTRDTLMRYLDGELPGEERRRFERALAGSTELQRELALFDAVKRDFHDLAFSPPPRNGGLWDQVNRRLTRPMGWFFFVAGAALWTGYGAWVFATSPGQVVEKLATGALVIGVLLLLTSVIYEQYQAWLTDPYRDVQR